MVITVVWPLSRTQYLTVSEGYYSAAAMCIDSPYAEVDTFVEPFAWKIYDFVTVASGVCTLEWRSLADLTFTAESRDMAIIGKHLKVGVERGLLERERRLVLVKGKARMRWFYRKVQAA